MEIKNLQVLTAKLQRMAAKSRTDTNVSVLVGYTAQYAVYVHENTQALHGEAYNQAYIRKIQTKKGIKKVWTDRAIAMGYHLQGKARTRGPNQQAKFLEQPARELSNSGEISRIVFTALAKKATMAQALVIAGLRIQRESMKLVPVDTGNLRASAFTRLEAGTG